MGKNVYDSFKTYQQKGRWVGPRKIMIEWRCTGDLMGNYMD
jgi:hypothetical protein